MKNLLNTLKTDRLFLKAQKLAGKGRLDSTLEEFDKALALSPADSSILLRKALALSDNNQYEDAINTIEKAIEINASNAVYHMFMGRIHYDNGEFDKALEAFDRSISLDPDNGLPQCYKNLTLLNTGYDEKAMELIIDEITNTNPEFQSRLLVLCESMLLDRGIRAEYGSNDKEKEKASPNLFSWMLVNAAHNTRILLGKLQYAVNRSKSEAYTHYIKGKMNLSLEKSSEAIVELKKALQIFPGLDEANEKLVEIYFESGDFKSALECLKATKEYREARRPADSEGGTESPEAEERSGQLSNFTRLILGITYYKLDEYDNAIEHLEPVIGDDSLDFEPDYYLGLCYLAQEKTRQALSLFRSTVEKTNLDFIRDRLEAVRKYCQE
jgi:tetratricopeptide (TPR) repeat protein